MKDEISFQCSKCPATDLRFEPDKFCQKLSILFI